MSKVRVELSKSLDGFVAGSNGGPENGLGDGGDGFFEGIQAAIRRFPLIK